MRSQSAAWELPPERKLLSLLPLLSSLSSRGPPLSSTSADDYTGASPANNNGRPRVPMRLKAPVIRAYLFSSLTIALSLLSALLHARIYVTHDKKRGRGNTKKKKKRARGGGGKGASIVVGGGGVESDYLLRSHSVTAAVGGILSVSKKWRKCRSTTFFPNALCANRIRECRTSIAQGFGNAVNIFCTIGRLIWFRRSIFSLIQSNPEAKVRVEGDIKDCNPRPYGALDARLWSRDLFPGIRECGCRNSTDARLAALVAFDISAYTNSPSRIDTTPPERGLDAHSPERNVICRAYFLAGQH